MGSMRTSESTRREPGAPRARRPGPPGPAGRVAARRRRSPPAAVRWSPRPRPGPRRPRRAPARRPWRRRRPGRLDDRHHAEVGHRGQRVHHLGAGAGPVRGRADRGEGLLRHDQRRGRRQRPQADRRLQGRRVQRPAEPDRDPGGDQQRLRPGGQLLALRRLRVRGAGQQHRRARRLGHARRRHQRAAQRLQRPAAVGRGDPRAGRVLQEALPQGHDGRGHRLGRGVGQDTRWPSSSPA